MNKCPSCGNSLEVCVIKSSEGYYIGRNCVCGPIERLSGFYQTESQAKSDLHKYKMLSNVPFWS